MNNKLLAKSITGDWNNHFSLLGHTADVLNATKKLSQAVGEDYLQAHKIPIDDNLLSQAAIAHDLGKANNGFQSMVKGAKLLQQFRHEVLSGFMLNQVAIDCGVNFDEVIILVLNHHRKIDLDASWTPKQGAGSEITIYSGHPDFTKIIDLFSQASKVLLNSDCKDKTYSVLALSKELRRFLETVVDNNESSRKLQTLSWLLIVADAIASTLEVSGTHGSLKPVTQKVVSLLSNGLTNTCYKKLIDSRLKKQSISSLRQFQVDAQKSTARVTVLLAGCGTGKTLGQLLWAQSNGCNKKLIITLPTTGTSTEIYLDYVHDLVDGALLHSRAKVDMSMVDTSNGEEEGDRFSSVAEEYSGKQVIVCTVDTALGIIHNYTKSIYLYPVFLKSVIVFDEAHCYDKRTFVTLLEFIKLFNIPVLIMSATLSKRRIEMLTEAAEGNINVIKGDVELEKLPRYNFSLVDNELEIWSHVIQETQKGGKVLWVCNTVDDVIDIYLKAKIRGINCILYHSRFRYKDRVKKHRQLIDSFNERKSILAIATQVAEISLDISATLLVTQIAPVGALIQRLGRLNRKYCGKALKAFFYAPNQTLPYKPSQIEDGLKFVHKFLGKEVSQLDLSIYMSDIDDVTKETLGQDIFLAKGNLRDNGYTISCVLGEDVKTLESLLNYKQVEYVVPIPSSWLPPDYETFGRRKYPIVTQSVCTYSSEHGAISSTKIVSEKVA